MIKAEYSDKKKIVDILCKAFDTNHSVNFIVKQDQSRMKRIRKLMEYCFNMCFMFGNVFLSEDKEGCVLIVLPDRKKTTLKSILLDVKLAILVVGLSNLMKVLKREARVKQLHPRERFCYLWFIGVEPVCQNRGIGSKLLNDVINEAKIDNRPIYLETSVSKNIRWYQKFGFTVYEKLDFSYELFCLKKE